MLFHPCRCDIFVVLDEFLEQFLEHTDYCSKVSKNLKTTMIPSQSCELVVRNYSFYVRYIKILCIGLTLSYR